MPYADKNKQAKYMKKYRTPYMHNFRQRKKTEKKNKDQLIAQFLKVSAERRREWLQMLDIIQQTMFIVGRTDLTDSEKVARIREIPIPKELALSMVKLLKEVTT